MAKDLAGMAKMAGMAKDLEGFGAGQRDSASSKYGAARTLAACGRGVTV